MEMHQIRYFLAICDHGSFTRAAQFTYISQPSLTQAIKKLEDELGGELFQRDRLGCRLTPLGRLVEPGFRNILKVSQTTKADAIRFTNLNNTPLRIGLMASIGAQRLGPLFARYQQKFPNIELELIIDKEADLLEQLESEALELAICSPSQTLREPYRSTLLYEERYVVAFSPYHRFNQMAKVNLKDLQSEPYLDRLNCELRDKLKKLCQDLKIDLYAAYRSNSEEWVLHMVRSGIGVALLPEYTLPANDAGVRHRYLDTPEISRRVYAIHASQFTKKSEFKDLIVMLNGFL